jgi:hypothetical protein
VLIVLSPVPAFVAATQPTPVPSATEIVERPDPGIARGKWEAPPWLFWVVAAAVVLAAAAYGVVRLALARARRGAR